MQKRRAFYESMLGKVVTVLFEQKKGSDWIGLTDNYLHVRVPLKKNLSNQLIPVKLMEIKGQEILARIQS